MTHLLAEYAVSANCCVQQKKNTDISISHHDSCGIIDGGRVVITAVVIVWA